jgi:hypothetical protein
VREVYALKVLVEGVEAGVGEETAEGVVVAVAWSEVEAVEAAKIEDSGAGASLVGGIGLSSRNAGWDFGFVFAEERVGGVRHRIGSFARVVKRDAGSRTGVCLSPRIRGRCEARGAIFDGAVKKGGRGRVFDAIMETPRL